MPLRAFSNLNLSRRKRLALLGIFLVGGIAVLASIIRLYALWDYTVSDDVSYDAIYVRVASVVSLSSLTTVQILLLSQIEVNVAIISASAPALRPLFQNAFPSSSYSQSGTPYGANEVTTNGQHRSAPHRQVELSSHFQHEMTNKCKPTKRRLTSSTSEEFILGTQGSGITKTTDMQIDVEQTFTAN